MRTVTGNTDHVVVVGAGLSGLSAAMHLAGRGRTGHRRRARGNPRRPRRQGRHRRLPPRHRPHRADDARHHRRHLRRRRGVDVRPARPPAGRTRPTAPPSPTAAASTSTPTPRRWPQRSNGSPGPGKRTATVRLRTVADRALPARVRRLHRRQLRLPAVPADPAAGAAGRDRRVPPLGTRWCGRFITDERLLRVFTFQALYVGVPPQAGAGGLRRDRLHGHRRRASTSPAAGCASVPDAMAAAAADAGVDFRYDATVTELERSGSRVTAVRTDTGERIPADAVILTTELPDTYRLLGRTPRAGAALRPAPSAVVVHIGMPRTWSAADAVPSHHSVRRRLAATFDEIIDDGRPDGGPVTARHPAHRRRPDPGPGRPRSALRPRAGTEHRCRAPGLGRTTRRLRRPHAGHRAHPRFRTSVTTPRCSTSSLRATGPARAWSPAPRSRWRTPSPRPVRSGRPTRCAASTTRCWRARPPCPASAFRPRIVSGRLAADRITGVVHRHAFDPGRCRT